MVEEWMNSSGQPFCLGTSEYTQADVFLTVMMVRLAVNKEYFAKEVLGRPKLKAYWEMV